MKMFKINLHKCSIYAIILLSSHFRSELPGRNMKEKVLFRIVFGENNPCKIGDHLLRFYIICQVNFRCSGLSRWQKPPIFKQHALFRAYRTLSFLSWSKPTIRSLVLHSNTFSAIPSPLATHHQIPPNRSSLVTHHQFPPNHSSLLTNFPPPFAFLVRFAYT
jgi:hypothetical protein